MRNRRNRVILSAILISPVIFSAAGQEAGLQSIAEPDNLFQARLSGEVFTPADRFANSQYYFENWVYGNVNLVSGDTVRNQQIQYNAYMDELFWLHPSFLVQIMLDKGLVAGFEAQSDRSGSTAIFRKMDMNNDAAGRRSGFFRLLLEDSVSLYSRRILRESSYTESSMVGNRLVTRIVLINDHRYFLGMPDGTMKPVGRNRRSLINAFPEIRRELRAGLRHDRNRIRNEEELIRAISLVNQLFLFSSQN